MAFHVAFHVRFPYTVVSLLFLRRGAGADRQSDLGRVPAAWSLLGSILDVSVAEKPSDLAVLSASKALAPYQP